MRLIELRMENFRQFAGTHSLQIAPTGQRNVTVVYGANGSGKTTLLNAFSWCLYSKLTQDFMYPDRLISDGLWATLPTGELAKAVVILLFEHEGAEFTLTRTATARKTTPQSDQSPMIEQSLIKRGPEGATVVPNPSDFIDSILPVKLHHFFFLNGERFDHLVSAKAYDDIAGAIKTILGIEIIERGIAHLKEVEKSFNSAFKAAATDQVGKILDELQEANNYKEELELRATSLQKDELQQIEEVDALDQKLRRLEGSKQAQGLRDELTSRYTNADASKARCISRRLELLSEDAFVAFVPTSAEMAAAKYSEMREKREIPRGIKLTFVEDLLEYGSCICGTDVSEPGLARTKLEAWKAKAGKPQLEDAWSLLGARALGWSGDDADRLRVSLNDIDSEISRLDIELETVDAKLSEVSKNLSSADEEDIRGTETRRNDATALLTKIKFDKYETERLTKETIRVISMREKELRDAQAASEEAALAKRRLVAAEDVKNALSTMKELRTLDVRSDLDARIKQIYGQVVKKRQIPSLTESFQLLLQEATGDGFVPKAMSTGEAQVLTLSFVGALAALAREKYEEGTSTNNPLVNVSGGIFPFVADAIFGTLDEAFRREVSRLLPDLTPQVVLFLSKAQAADDVNTQLRDRLGAVAIIDAKMSRTDIATETISYDDREFPYVTTHTGEYDVSELVQVLQPEIAR